MKQTFLDFVAARKENEKHLKALNEAFKEEDVDKAIELISKVLTKHIDGLVPIEGYVDVEIDGKACTAKQFLVLDKKDPYHSAAFQFNWLNSAKSAEVYSIDFFKDSSDLIWSGKAKSDLTIKTLGSSIVYFLPIVWTVVTSGNYKLTEKEAVKAGEKIFKDEKVKESYYSIGNLDYRLLEGIDESVVEETFNITVNEVSDEVKAYKKQKRAEAMDAYKHRNDSPEAKAKNKVLWEEYDKIVKAIQTGRVETMEDLKLAISGGETVIVKTPASIAKHENDLEGDNWKKEPNQVFKEMQKYIKMVMQGIQPSLIICGAPGVGKTYKVKKQLKAGGYELGKNLSIINGRCTPRRLFIELYDYKKKKDILLIDDADGLVGPKAPEDSINILKAALDSTADDEGRLVNYGIAGKLLDDDGIECPKKFYYNGGVIILTNYNAGQLNTALRGRSFIQDIHFDSSDMLKIIKDLLPEIEPQLYSAKAKMKAYNYLVELNEEGSKMELSLRTFGICAKLFQTADGDDTFTDEDVRSMIKEQMKMQALRGGKSY